jgi:hypothetical protein
MPKSPTKRPRGSHRIAAAVGYEGLQPFLDTFAQDHPEVEKNVFIAMRFRDGKQFTEIHQSVKTSLAKYGLFGLRADDKVYPLDGDLWSNVCVYMLACKYAVCVFEEIDEREFNPNVPLEFGFMRALNRQVLLLKDQRMPLLPTDMTGKVYRPFDSYDISETTQRQVGEWAERDLGFRPVAAKVPLAAGVSVGSLWPAERSLEGLKRRLDRMSETNARILKAIAGAGEYGLYADRLSTASGVPREKLIFRGKEMESQGLIEMLNLTDINFRLHEDVKNLLGDKASQFIAAYIKAI